MIDFFNSTNDENEYRRIFNNWGYEDKVIISRCYEMINRIREHLYTFNYENIKQGIAKDITFNDACLNQIVQIRKQIMNLSKDHLSDIQKTGIIVIPPKDIQIIAKPFIPFNDIVYEKMIKVFSMILGKYEYENLTPVGEAKFKTPLRGIYFRENKKLIKLKKSIINNLEEGSVILISDTLSIINKVERMQYHFQRLEIENLYNFKKDKAAVDSISYTLIETLKIIEKSSKQTQKLLEKSELNLKKMLVPHILINQKGMNQFAYISENDYIESLWEQVGSLNKSIYYLANSIPLINEGPSTQIS